MAQIKDLLVNGSARVIGTIYGNASSANKVNNKLTVGSKTYDGSAAVTIAARDLGLASAMLFLGTTTTAITDGAKTNPVVISGSNKTVKAGNVVLYGSKEFVWTGSAWEELGNEGSYKIVQAAVGDPSASGISNTFIATISQDTNGKITTTKKTVAVTNSAPTLEWGKTSTIGTVAGTNLQVKMPANPNVDTKVTQTVTTSNATYPLLLAPNGQTSTTTTTSYFDSGVTLNPSTNTIAANVSGNATTATKLATARNITIGNKTNSFNGSADITYNLQDILVRADNEFNYTADGIDNLWFNYKTQTGNNSTTKITKYFFGNGQGSTDGVTIYASNFSGNAATATNADTVDGYHENSFFRYRDVTSTDQTGSLWTQIGSRSYHGALPDGLSGLYNWGQVLSFPGNGARLDIWCSHTSSSNGNLWYRSGWGDDKQPWRRLIDSANIGSQTVNRSDSSGWADAAWRSERLLINGATNEGIFNWNGQGGQPTWLWGSNDGVNMYVWNPSNFSVNYSNSSGWASSAGNADTVDGYHASDLGKFYGINTSNRIAYVTSNTSGNDREVSYTATQDCWAVLTRGADWPVQRVWIDGVAISSSNTGQGHYGSNVFPLKAGQTITQWSYQIDCYISVYGVKS